MSEAGYTLVEMLVALMIIGLAIGGVAESTQVLAQMQTRAVRLSDSAMGSHAADETLTTLFDRQGPFRSDVGTNLVGQRRVLAFPCLAGHCGAALKDVADGTELEVNLPSGRTRRVQLTGLRRLSFSYIDPKGAGQVWPPTNPTDWRLLRAVSVTDDSSAGSPLAIARLWLEQPSACSAAGGCGAAQ